MILCRIAHIPSGRREATGVSALTITLEVSNSDQLLGRV
jgi:hypothetical protein